MVDGVILLLTPWPILLLANILLLVGVRRARHDSATPGGRPVRGAGAAAAIPGSARR